MPKGSPAVKGRARDRSGPDARAGSLFLVDGHGLAYRAFYAMIQQPLRTSTGENTSVPYGLTLFLRKILADHAPDYVAAVFDAGRGTTFRHELYPPYKATRQKLDKSDQMDFRLSMERIRQILEAFRVPAIEVEGYEADDVIGTLARAAAAKGLQAVIVSGDTDFYQLIGPGIAVIEPGRGGRSFIEARWVDEDAAEERMGVPPERVTDYLALVGDPSDNVPGVRGIGHKTAVELIARFGPIEKILERAETLENKRARQALSGHAEQAVLSKRLVTLRTDAPVGLDLDAFSLRAPDVARLRELFIELEFQSMLPELAPRECGESRCSLIEGPRELALLMQEAMERGRVALYPVFDAAAGSRPGAGLMGLGIAVEAGRAAYLPLGGHAGGPGAAARARLDSDEMRPLAEVLAAPGVEKVGHDVKRILLWLRRAGLEAAGPMTDVMLASYCLDPGKRSHDLEALVIEQFGSGLVRQSEFLGKRESLADVPPEKVLPYAAQRADYSLRLADRLLRGLDLQGLRRVYEEIEMPLVPVLADMEGAGVALDTGVLESLGKQMAADLARLEAEIYALAGEPFNVDSPLQLRRVLFEGLRLPVRKRTKTGASTDAEVLAELAAEGHELPGRLLEYRELAKLKSTYVDAFPRLVDPETGRIHTSFNQAATATGRLSSSEPNLQNIPIRSRLGAGIRKAFVAPQGSVLLAGDYSQIELRVLAHLAREPDFIEAFRTGRDVHRETAARLFELTLEEVTARERSVAKTVNYATLYGQGAPALARRLGLRLDEAESFIQGYFARFPAIRAYLDRQISLAREDGYVETLFGRRRYIPELRSRNPGIIGFGERVARNSPIQGSAADLIKIAMIRIHGRLGRQGYRARMVLQVHDELVFELPEEERLEVGRLVRSEMEGAVRLEVPIAVDIGTGKNWYAAKENREPVA
ncbi:MAG: DNA polymerase I [bacterium]